MSSSTAATTTTGYTIRTRSKVLTTAATLGEALAWAERHPDVTGAAILWGSKGSRQNLREWALMTRHNLSRLTSRGLSTAALLANDGTR